MSTDAQRAANQANAQHSTGPTTEEGKAISSQNRRKFGLTGRFTVLPWEDQEDFNLLVTRLRAEHQPTIAFETDLIEKMAQHFWLAQRAALLQEICFDRETPHCDCQKQLALYLRYQTTHERAFDRCASELRRLRKEREKAKIGFESQSGRKPRKPAAKPTKIAAKLPKIGSRSCTNGLFCSPKPRSTISKCSLPTFALIKLWLSSKKRTGKGRHDEAAFLSEPKIQRGRSGLEPVNDAQQLARVPD